MSRLVFYFLTILFWFGPMAAQAYYTYDPRVYSPRYPQCMEEYNKCDEPCLTQMGGNASYACHNACAANFDKCVAGDSQRENVEDINSQYRLKQKCDNLRSSCELYTCDKFHGMGESRACFESCKAQADQCMAAIQPSQNQGGRQWRILILLGLGPAQVSDTATITVGDTTETVTINQTTSTQFAGHEFTCSTGSVPYTIKTVTGFYNEQGRLAFVNGEASGNLSCYEDSKLEITGDYSINPPIIKLQRLMRR